MRALVLLGLGLLVGCTEADRPAPKPAAHATSPKPAARMVIMTDLQGYLEPCGCQARPLGGIDRATEKLSDLRAKGVPTVVLAAGDLLFEAGGAHKRQDDKARTQEVWKAETLLRILNGLPLAAAVPGPGDLRFGQDTFTQLAGQARFPLLGAGDGSREPLALLDVGETKLGVFGLSALGREGEAPLEAATLTREARELVARARAGGADITVALVQASAREARRMAGATEGLDFVVLAGRTSDETQPPSRLGDTHILTGARHGRGLLVVDLFPAGQGAFEDVSAWTRKATRATQARAIAELETRIATWEKDPGVDPGQLAHQRTRLARLRAEADGRNPASGAVERAFAARLIELGPEAPKDPGTSALLASYDKRVNAHNKQAFADWKPEPAPSGQPAYVGSDQCRSCHAPAYAWWQGHPHGTAYTTLTRRNKEFNLSCVGCHVTGYLQPGGSTVTHNEGLIHVGCESCHGPGSMHNGDKTGIVRAPEESVCVQCHNEEHSAAFDFPSYRARLLVPGHGLPGEEGDQTKVHDPG